MSFDAFDVERDLLPLARGLAFFVELIVLIVIGKFAKSRLAGYALDDELTQQDNPAIGVSFAGYVGGMLVALSGVFFGPGTGDFLYDLGSVAAWGVFAIVALNLSRILVDRVALAGFGNVEELVRDRNFGVGVCEAGGYLAAGLIVRMAVLGEGAWWLAPVFLVLGLLMFFLGATLLKKLVFRRFALIEEIERDNIAAGVLLGLHLLAVGWVSQAALERMFLEDVLYLASDATEVAIGFGVELGLALLYTLVGVLGLTVLSFVTDRLMLHGSHLHKEVVEDRSTGAAMVAGSVAVFGAVIMMSIF